MFNRIGDWFWTHREFLREFGMLVGMLVWAWIMASVLGHPLP